MRFFDQILQEETKNNFTCFEDLECLKISPYIVNTLIDECKTEFELEGDITIEDLSDNMGIRVEVDPDLVEDFKFVQR